MALLLKLSHGIDAVNRRIGQFFALMVLLAILVSAINASVRKVFDLSSNAWLELQWVLFSTVFLFCAPWTLQLNERCFFYLYRQGYMTLANGALKPPPVAAAPGSTAALPAPPLEASSPKAAPADTSRPKPATQPGSVRKRPSPAVKPPAVPTKNPFDDR